jgi:CubicO group peptidase (beta-lactamase class C family)
MRALVPVLVALTLWSCSSRPPQDDSISRLEVSILPLDGGPDAAPQPVADRMAHYHVPGLSVAIIRDDRIVWVSAHGLRTAGTADMVGVSTIFQAASLSKTVTAALAMQLVEVGRLDLDRDVNRDLRSWRVPAAPIPLRSHPVTLAELLSHRAGLSVPGFPGYPADARLPDLKQILDGRPPANTKAVRVQWLPGAELHYSGGGYEVVQQLLMDATSSPFPLIAEQQVLAPVNMVRSGYWQPLPEDLWEDAATAHNAAGTPIPGRARVYPELAAAGLWSTPVDLAHFAIELSRAWSGRSSMLMKLDTARRMLTPQGDGRTGLGVFLDGEGASLRFRQPGDNAGYHALMVAYADGRFGAVAMTNGEGGRQLVVEVINNIARLEAWPDFTPLKVE